LGRLFPPPASTAKDTLFLTGEEARLAAEEAGAPLPSKIVTRYVARRKDDAGERIVGHVYVDTHVVRTAAETLLIVVGTDARVRRIEVLTFDEPPEYRPSPRWYAQFEGRGLDRDLDLRRGIRTLAGATLSSRSTTEAVRRVLAVHRVVGENRKAP